MKMTEAEKIKSFVSCGLTEAQATLAAKSPKASQVELTESVIEPLPFISKAKNAERAAIEKRIKENAGTPRLMEAYKGLGLTEAEAKIACNVEERLTSIDMSKFEF